MVKELFGGYLEKKLLRGGGL